MRDASSIGRSMAAHLTRSSRGDEAPIFPESNAGLEPPYVGCYERRFSSPTTPFPRPAFSATTAHNLRPAMRQLVIGIDSGTQSTKALVMDSRDGKVLGSGVA